MKRKKKPMTTIGIDVDQSSTVVVENSKFIGLNKGIQVRGSSNIFASGNIFAADAFEVHLIDLESRLEKLLEIIETESDQEMKEKKQNCVHHAFDQIEKIKDETNIVNKERMYQFLMNFIAGTGAQIIGTMALHAVGLM